MPCGAGRMACSAKATSQRRSNVQPAPKVVNIDNNSNPVGDEREQRDQRMVLDAGGRRPKYRSHQTYDEAVGGDRVNI